MYSYYNRSRHASNACLNFQVRVVRAGGGGWGEASPPTRFFAELLTLSQPGGQFVPPLPPPLDYSDPPTVLQATVLPTRTHLRILKALNWTQIGPTSTYFGSLFFYVFGEGRFMVSSVWSFTFLAKGWTTYDFVSYVTWFFAFLQFWTLSWPQSNLKCTKEAGYNLNKLISNFEKIDYSIRLNGGATTFLQNF